MALISTEEAAKRLARVILSDIELYSRERPQAGETLEAQIEQGRKLFGSRVTPAVVPLFDVVLADRHAANGKTPAAAANTPLPAAGPSAPEIQLVDDRPAPPSPPVTQTLDKQTIPARMVSNQARDQRPTPVVLVALRDLADQRPSVAVVSVDSLGLGQTPGPVVRVPADERTPAPALIRTPEPRRVAPPAFATASRTPLPRFRVEPLPSVPPAVAPGAMSATPPSGSPFVAPVPVLTVRLSIPRLLAVLAIVAGAIAMFFRYVP